MAKPRPGRELELSRGSAGGILGPVLRIDTERWKQTIEDLRDAAYRAEDARRQERFLALYEIARGSNATQVAAPTGRRDDSVMAWVHAYNERGPTALTYRRTGTIVAVGANGRPWLDGVAHEILALQPRQRR